MKFEMLIIYLVTMARVKMWGMLVSEQLVLEINKWDVGEMGS